MTNKELQEILEKYPDDSHVLVDYDNYLQTPEIEGYSELFDQEFAYAGGVKTENPKDTKYIVILT